MGGFGSTRWEYHRKKRLVEDCYQLDMLKFNQWGLIPGPHASGSTIWANALDEILASVSYEIFPQEDYQIVRLRYIAEFYENKKELQYDVKAVSTRLHNGGNRWWFICPLIIGGKKCEHRVRILYLPQDEEYFGCRHCHNLTYRSSQSHDKQVDAFLSLTREQLLSILQEGSIKSKFLAIKALDKKFGL